MRRVLGICVLAAWPVLYLGSIVWEGYRCGFNRGLFEDTVCKSPDKPRPRGNLGNAYMEKHEWAKAVEQFERAASNAQARPADKFAQADGARALANIGYVYLLLKRYDEADRYLARARNEFPPDHLVLNNTIELFLVTGQVERALALGEAALRTFPDSAALMYTMADIYAVIGDCETWKVWKQKGYKQDPTTDIYARPCFAPQEKSY